MEGRQFDAIVRAIGNASSRRALLERGVSGVVGLVLAVTGIVQGDGDLALAKRKRQNNGRHAHTERKGGGGGKGGKGKGGKKNECENNSDCRQPDNPCEKKVCKGGKCQTELRQDGAECGTGQVCAAGTCVAACGGSNAPCADGLTCCAGACVNTSASFSNCGSCGGACSQDTATTCAAGSCRCGNNAACSVGQLCSGGQCCGDTGNTCNGNGNGAECCSGVCNCDGGKPTNPQDNQCHANAFSQTFQTSTAGWFDWDAECGPTEDCTGFWPGTSTTIQKQGDHAQIMPGNAYLADPQLTAMTLWGGYSSEFPQGGYDTSLDIFLDPAAASNNQHFDYTSAINGTNCRYLAEGIFHAGKSNAGNYCVSAGGGSSPDIDPCAETSPVPIAQADWYNFKHKFRNVGGQAEITMELRRGNNLLGTWTLPNLGGSIGGNRYGWFPVNEIGPLQVRNSQRS